MINLILNFIISFIPSLFIIYFIFKYYKVFLSGNEPNDFMKKNIGNYRSFFERDNIKHFYYYRVNQNSNKLLVAVPGFGGSVDSYKSFFNKIGKKKSKIFRRKKLKVLFRFMPFYNELRILYYLRNQKKLFSEVLELID